MYDKTFYYCPHCEAIVRDDLTDGGKFTCHVCGKRFSVMLDASSGKAGFVELTTREVPEPLYLPRGSIRALSTMALAGSSWVMILWGQEVPQYLFGLLLGTIAYYFALRQKLKAAQSRILDASAKAQAPLFLPSGVIRAFLIGGFMVSGYVLLERGLLLEMKYLEFFIILAGLVVGYVFGRLFNRSEGSLFYIYVNHLKGLAVLVAAACLAYLMIGGGHEQHPRLAMALASAISFYFGSRS